MRAPTPTGQDAPNLGSNGGMPTTPPDFTSHDQRLTDLEIKASFAEDLLDTLNTLVARQQEQIELLLREVSRQRQQGGDAAMAAPRNLRDELPPHY
jgi:SlyX protein